MYILSRYLGVAPKFCVTRRGPSTFSSRGDGRKLPNHHHALKYTRRFFILSVVDFSSSLIFLLFHSILFTYLTANDAAEILSATHFAWRVLFRAELEFPRHDTRIDFLSIGYNLTSLNYRFAATFGEPSGISLSRSITKVCLLSTLIVNTEQSESSR